VATDWQLKSDQQAGKLFIGKPPGLSKTPDWRYEQKNLTSP